VERSSAPQHGGHIPSFRRRHRSGQNGRLRPRRCFPVVERNGDPPLVSIGMMRVLNTGRSLQSGFKLRELRVTKLR